MNYYLPAELFAFIGAFSFFLIIRSRDIIIVSKKCSQRNPDEELRVKRGLRRSLILEIFIFVPVSALLMILISPLILPFTQNINQAKKVYAWYTLLGIASYGFPFAAIKEVIIQMAFEALKECSKITPEYEKEEEMK